MERRLSYLVLICILITDSTKCGKKLITHQERANSIEFLRKFYNSPLTQERNSAKLLKTCNTTDDLKKLSLQCVFTSENYDRSCLLQLYQRFKKEQLVQSFCYSTSSDLFCLAFNADRTRPMHLAQYVAITYKLRTLVLQLCKLKTIEQETTIDFDPTCNKGIFITYTVDSTKSSAQLYTSIVSYLTKNTAKRDLEFCNKACFQS